MAADSSIEWTGATWNPVTGCDKVSTGCKHCYAERMAFRLRLMGASNYANGFEVTFHPQMLERPLSWRRPKRVFVNSMSDLFHDDVPDDFIFSVFDVMKRAHWHEFQILTKRSARLAQLAPKLSWPTNVWMGVSVECALYTNRIDDLRSVPAAVRFLSLEPLVGPLDKLDLTGIHWAIVGGESGPGARPMKEAWVRDIRDQCVAAGVPFFFKQWGGVVKSRNGRELDGRMWDDFPHSSVSPPVNSRSTQIQVARRSSAPAVAATRRLQAEGSTTSGEYQRVSSSASRRH